MKDARIYIRFWDANTNTEEWRPFSTEDAVEFLEPDEDPDAFAYAMWEADAEALEATLTHFYTTDDGYWFGKFVDYFLSITDKNIYIK